MDRLSLGIIKERLMDFILNIWNWIKARAVEWSSIDGVLIIVASSLILLGKVNLIGWLAWPALAFGIWRVIQAEK